MSDEVKPAEQERAAFETWARREEYSLRRDAEMPARYFLSSTQRAWEAWQAHAATVSDREAKLVEALRGLLDVAEGKTEKPGNDWKLIDKARAALSPYEQEASHG